MDQVKVFLRTPLFSSSLKNAGPSILVGRVRENVSGGLIIAVDQFLSTKGEPVQGWQPSELFVPMSKIDYAQLLEN